MNGKNIAYLVGGAALTGLLVGGCGYRPEVHDGEIGSTRYTLFRATQPIGGSFSEATQEKPAIHCYIENNGTHFYIANTDSGFVLKKAYSIIGKDNIRNISKEELENLGFDPKAAGRRIMEAVYGYPEIKIKNDIAETIKDMSLSGK